MTPRLIRPFLIVEFLLAVQVWLTLWSEVGGQYHLDLMFWPWKFGITMAAACLTTAITANLFHNNGDFTRRAVVYAAMLFAVAVVAGVVTYYYHMNEPTDDGNGDAQSTATALLQPARVVTKPGRPLRTPSVYRPNN
jgi:hypothetical protein